MTVLKIHNQVLCVYIYTKILFWDTFTSCSTSGALEKAPIETPTNLLAIGELLTVANKNTYLANQHPQKRCLKGAGISAPSAKPQEYRIDFATVGPT